MKKNLAILILSISTFCFGQRDSKFAKGADISWTPQMEATGYEFYNEKGEKDDVLKILKSKGMDAIRLRVFVNPNDDKGSGHCSKEETVAFAKRLKSLGFRIMIDFHYSDSWADPAKQYKPKAWENLNFEDLKKAVYNHTYDVLLALKKEKITPEWVQVGNEIPNGILWPDGHSKNFKNLGELLNKGYDAVKAVNKKIKVIVHIDEGNNTEKITWFYKNIAEQNVKYDVIGLSYYPYWIKKDWTETIQDLQKNMNYLAKTYNKEVMVVEVGGEDSQVENTYKLLEATIKAVRNVPNKKGTGVFYWEPQGAKSWSGYALSAWLENGRPSPALDAFLEKDKK
jgi:arabinogalactan endo-1,4-beta-galactosidase